MRKLARTISFLTFVLLAAGIFLSAPLRADGPSSSSSVSPVEWSLLKGNATTIDDAMRLQSWQPWEFSKSVPLLSGPGTVWLRGQLQNLNDPEPVFIVPRLRDNVQIYFESKKIFEYSSIVPLRGRYVGMPIQLVPLSSGGGTYYVSISSDLTAPKISASIHVGNRSDVILKHLKKEFFTLASGIVLMFMSVCCIVLFFTMGRIAAFLSFAGMAFGVGVYLIGRCQTPLLLWPYPLAVESFQYAWTYCSPFFFLLLSEHLIGGFSYRLLSLLKWIFLTFGLLTPAISFLGFWPLPETLIHFQALLAICVVIYLADLAVRGLHFSGTGKAFVLGAAILAASALLEVLATRYWLDSGEAFLGTTMLLFVVHLAVVMGKKVQEDFRRRLNVQRSLDTAEVLQKSFLPAMTHVEPRFSISVYNRSAEKVGGDWFSYRLVHDRYLHVHLGDVTGHGTKAALLAAYARGALDSLYMEPQVLTGRDAMFRIQDRLHRTLWDLGHSDATMTMISVEFDLETGSMITVSAAHPAPQLIAHEEGDVRKLSIRSRSIIGFSEDLFEADPREDVFRTGDTLVIGTDGFHDVFRNKEILKSTTLNRFLRDHRGESVDFFAESTALLVELVARTAPLEDDVTVVAVKRGAHVS